MDRPTEAIQNIEKLYKSVLVLVFESDFFLQNIIRLGSILERARKSEKKV